MDAPETTPRSILWIGNSFTARNDLPGLVAKLAAAAGRTLEHQMISANGAPLRLHWNKGEAQQAIESGAYDTVVLQEQSTLPIKNATRFHENVRLFVPVIREAGARPLLYMTWARRAEPQNQALLTAAYTTIGAELDATVVPVGTAWERCLSQHDAPVLHDADGSHPTLAGSYLAACVFHGVLYAQTPVGLDFTAGLAEAPLLQATAAAATCV